MARTVVESAVRARGGAVKLSSFFESQETIDPARFDGVQAACAASALDAAAGLDRFAEWMRAEPLLFRPCRADSDARALFDTCFQTLFAIGEHSIPFGVAAAMHLYMLCAIASYPLRDESQRARRAAFLEAVGAQRWLVANSGSDSETRANNRGRSATTAQRTPEGIRISGSKTYVSLAQVADLLIFTAAEAATGGVMSLYTTLKNNPAVQTVESPLPAEFAASGTRTVCFRDLLLPPENLIGGSDGIPNEHAFLYQRLWFLALIPAVYLGAFHGALTETRNFCRGVYVNGHPLAALDGVTAEVGQLFISLVGALSGIGLLGTHIARATRLDATPEELTVALNLAAAFKYTSTRAACAGAASIRRLVGLRSMEPASRIHRFLSTVGFGPLHPEIEPMLERRLGSEFLGGAG